MSLLTKNPWGRIPYTQNTPNELPILLCGIIQPLVVLFFVQTFLFDNDARINHPSILRKTYWNLAFSSLLILYIVYLYKVLAIPERYFFNIGVIVVYLTLFCWVLLNAADFDFALHKSVWMGMYAVIVIIESVLWIMCIYCIKKK